MITPVVFLGALQMLNRALSEGDEMLEKKARRAIYRQSARERVHVRERAAKVLAEKRRVEQTPALRCAKAPACIRGGVLATIGGTVPFFDQIVSD